MTKTVIRVENLSKEYRIGTTRHSTLRDSLADIGSKALRVLDGLRHTSVVPQKSERDRIWALREASFEVKRGEVVGIIGHNGSGKSTLLKLLSRITEPTKGCAELHGRVGSLLEVGTGFHPELTGRENTYLNGAILGMRKTEIDKKFDEIISFAEIERFVDTPVKRYSSGMYVRLAFAVAAHLETEILLVDEVLAVGDAVFQRKCLGKMEEVAHKGRTILFVSHNMGAVQSLCPRAILLRKGRIAADGASEEVVREYLAHLAEGTKNAFSDNPERSGNGSLRFTDARVLDEFGQPAHSLTAGRKVTFQLAYENRSRAKSASATMTIYNHLGVPVTTFDMSLTNHTIDDLASTGAFVCRVPKLPLPIGQYRVAVAAWANGGLTDHIPNALGFEVENSTFFRSGRAPTLNACTCLVAHEWNHQPNHPPTALETRGLMTGT